MEVVIPLAALLTLIGVMILPVTGTLIAAFVVPLIEIAVPLAAVAATSTAVVPKGIVT